MTEPTVADTRVQPCAAISAQYRIAATPMAVRQVLLDLRGHWSQTPVTCRLAATAEQVLAEVLNNIVEHAQAGRQNGLIEINAMLDQGALVLEVRDDGCAMPDGALPGGQAARIGDVVEDLPEGGFGWFMIHSLTRHLSYRRDAGWNCLRFQIAG